MATSATGAILCLGMAFASETFSTASRAGSGTTVAAVRDRARLLELQRRTGTMVISMNDVHAPHQCEPGHHVQGSFGHRVVPDVKALLGDQALKMIIGDYVRFPTEYMRAAYLNFFKSMLAALLKHGLIDTSTVIVMPNLDGLVNQQKLTGPAGKAWKLSMTRLQANQNPLYVATEGLGDDVMGGITNQGELRSLNSEAPFVAVTLQAM